jgi:hypothetical protein
MLHKGQHYSKPLNRRRRKTFCPATLKTGLVLTARGVLKCDPLFPLQQHTAMTKTRKSHEHLTPAQVVVMTFEGVRATARVLEMSPGAVSRWQTLRHGRVPGRHHITLLDEAKKIHKELTPHDLVYGRDVSRKG